MERYEWLLLAIGNGMIEPVQVQKLMFLFSQETQVPEAEAYEFVPYNWGPCSFDIYADMDSFINDDIVERFPTNRGWSSYGLTDKGRATVAQLRKVADKTHLEELNDCRAWVTSMTFRGLLNEVYRKYPQYAVASEFTD